MSVKPFLNRSERRTLDLLERTLCDSAWAPYAKVRLPDVLDLDPQFAPHREKWMLLMGHFDFLVVSRGGDSLPAFAIEFDSSWHDDPAQRERDAVKDDLCARQGLHVLRMTDQETTARDNATMLEWIVERFKDFQTEKRRITRLSTPEERAQAELALLTENPFPAVSKVIARLHRYWTITCTDWRSWGGAAAVLGGSDQAPLCVTPDPFYLDSLGLLGDDFGLDGPRWQPFRTTGLASLLVVRPGGEVVRRAQASVEMVDPDWAHISALKELIGIDYEETQACLAEYLALREVERWAQRELVEIAA